MAYNSVGGNDSTEEVVVAYGRMWKYNLGGQLTQVATDLKSLARYTTVGINGGAPCSGLTTSQTCTINTLTILNHDSWGFVESVTANGRYWNFNAMGVQWSGAGSDTALTTVSRYGTVGFSVGGSSAGPCSYAPIGSTCKFDTVSFTDVRRELGEYVESITAYGHYFLYRADGSLIGSGAFSTIPRYKDGPSFGGSAPGPCTYKPAASVCQFDSHDVKRVGGQLIEVITAYGRFWEFNITDPAAPFALPGTGIETKDVPRFR